MWANKELDGYEGTNGDDLPTYRIIHAHAHGDFFAPTRYQAPLRDFPIAPIALEEPHRKFARLVYLFEGVGAYEHVMQNRDTGGRLIFEWPANLMAYYQRKPIVQGGFVLTKAWQEIPSNAVAHLLDTVRTRTLNMVVEIKEQLGEEIQHPSPAAMEKVERTVNNYVGTAIFASDHAQVQINQLDAGDWDQLVKLLRQSGLTDGDVAELSEAKSADGDKMGEAVMAWIRKMAPKALVGGVKLTATVAQQMLTEYMKKHFGF